MRYYRGPLVGLRELGDDEMQVKINPLSLTRTSPISTNDKKGGTVTASDFIDAIMTAGMADTPTPSAGNGSAVSETNPMELYQSATGRTIDKSQPSQKPWTQPEK